MEYKFENGVKVLVFDDQEEMKWYMHKRLCQCEINEEQFKYFVKYVLHKPSVYKADFWLGGERSRVKKPEET